MLDAYYIFASLLLWQVSGITASHFKSECSGKECDGFTNACSCLHPSEIYCNAYYISTKIFTCSPGLLFDEDSITCDYENNVKCGNRTQMLTSVSPTQVSTIVDNQTVTISDFTVTSTAPETYNRNATKGIQFSNEDNLVTTEKIKVKDNTSETTDPSKFSDGDILVTADKTKVSEDDISETTKSTVPELMTSKERDEQTASSRTELNNITQSISMTFDTSPESTEFETTNNQEQSSVVTPNITEEVVDNFTCPLRFGLFPDPENCNFFYQCSHSLPYHMKCPSELHFNPISKVCDWPFRAGCEVTTSHKPTFSIPTTSSSNFFSTNIVGFLSSTGSSTIKNIESSESESTSVDISLKPKHTSPIEKEATESITLVPITISNSTDVNALITNISTISVTDEVDKGNHTKGPFDTSLTTEEIEIFSDSNSLHENITLQPMTTENFKTTENTTQYELTVHYNTTRATSKLTTIDADLTNISKPVTDSEKFTNSLKTTTLELLVNISTHSTNEIPSLSTINGSSTKKSRTTMQPDGNNTTETLPVVNTTEDNYHNFTCMTKFGLFPDPGNCNYFYQCSHFIPYHIQCPSNLHFNPRLEVCDWPYRAGCVIEETSTVNEVTVGFDCPSRFGLFPDIYNCTRFYQCSHWISYPKKCPSELHFNTVLKVCDFPYRAGCNTSLIL